MTTRDKLIHSMKELLWERGYDATSPNHVLERSGAGKGSFYHHFKGKKELAIVAMDSQVDELIDQFEEFFSGNKTWLEKLETSLLLPRSLKGCPIGRITQDPSLSESEDLRAPVKRYFQHITHRIEQVLTEAQNQGELSKDLDAHVLSLAISSVIQGGYIVGRACDEEKVVNQACRGIVSLLRFVGNHS